MMEHRGEGKIILEGKLGVTLWQSLEFRIRSLESIQ